MQCENLVLIVFFGVPRGASEIFPIKLLARVERSWWNAEQKRRYRFVNIHGNWCPFAGCSVSWKSCRCVPSLCAWYRWKKWIWAVFGCGHREKRQRLRSILYCARMIYIHFDTLLIQIDGFDRLFKIQMPSNRCILCSADTHKKQIYLISCLSYRTPFLVAIYSCACACLRGRERETMLCYWLYSFRFSIYRCSIGQINWWDWHTI